MTIPPGATDESIARAPAKALLKRIDIGLTTGIVAVGVDFMSLLVARAQTRMALEAQKASVLPIIDIDLGYENASDRSNALFASIMSVQGLRISKKSRRSSTVNLSRMSIHSTSPS